MFPAMLPPALWSFLPCWTLPGGQLSRKSSKQGPEMQRPVLGGCPDLLTSVGLKARGLLGPLAGLATTQRPSCCKTSRKFWAGLPGFWGELPQAPGIAGLLSAGLGLAAEVISVPFSTDLAPAVSLPSCAGAKRPWAPEPSREARSLCCMALGRLGQHNPPCPDFSAALGVLVSKPGPGVLKGGLALPSALCGGGRAGRQQPASPPPRPQEKVVLCLHSVVLEWSPYFSVPRNLSPFL